MSEQFLTEGERIRREKLSKAHKGKRLSPEHRLRLSIANLNSKKIQHQKKMRRIIVKKYCRIKPKLNKKVEQILLGSLFGDGCLRIRTGGVTPNYIEAHSLEQSLYLTWKSKYLNQITEGRLAVHCPKTNPNFSYTTPTSLQFAYYYKQFYPKGEKKLTKKLMQSLDWLGIAVWFCDDGYYNPVDKNLSFSMHPSFKSDAISFFKTKGFKFKDYKEYEIWLGKHQTTKFVSKIRPFVQQMPKIIHYKVGR